MTIQVVTTHAYVSILILTDRISASIKVCNIDVTFTNIAIVTVKNTKMALYNRISRSTITLVTRFDVITRLRSSCQL